MSSSFSGIKAIWHTILNVGSSEMKRRIQEAAIKVLLREESDPIAKVCGDKIVTVRVKGSRVLKKLPDSHYVVVCGILKEDREVKVLS